MKRDAVVLGAGPAGALAALLLARAGRTVTLLDRTPFPRPKVCGDCFNPRVGRLLERHGLGAGYAALPHAPLDAFEIEAEGRIFHRGPVPGGGFRAIDRALFDAWLVGEAQKAGTEFIDGVRISALRADGRVTTDRGEFTATCLVGADGRNSFAARQAGLLRPGRDDRVGWQLRLFGVKPSEAVRLNVFREGYYGIVALPGGEANLSMVLDADARVAPGEIVRRYLPQVRIAAERSIAPVSRAALRPARDALWLVGDAARVVEPFTGEGILFALASAELAAGFLARAGGADAEAQALYRREHRLLYRRLGVNRLACWLLGSRARRRAVAGLRHAPGLVRLLAGKVLEG